MPQGAEVIARSPGSEPLFLCHSHFVSTDTQPRRPWRDALSSFSIVRLPISFLPKSSVSGPVLSRHGDQCVGLKEGKSEASPWTQGEDGDSGC